MRGNSPPDPEVPGGNNPGPEVKGKSDPDPDVPGGDPADPEVEPPVPVKAGENCPVDKNFIGSRNDGTNGDPEPELGLDDEVPLELDPDDCAPFDDDEKLGSVNVPG